MRDDPQIKARLPQALTDFLKSEAEKNGSSLNSEIIRAVRERMERMQPPAQVTALPSPPAQRA